MAKVLSPQHGYRPSLAGHRAWIFHPSRGGVFPRPLNDCLNIRRQWVTREECVATNRERVANFMGVPASSRHGASGPWI